MLPACITEGKTNSAFDVLQIALNNLEPFFFPDQCDLPLTWIPETAMFSRSLSDAPCHVLFQQQMVQLYGPGFKCPTCHTDPSLVRPPCSALMFLPGRCIQLCTYPCTSGSCTLSSLYTEAKKTWSHPSPAMKGTFMQLVSFLLAIRCLPTVYNIQASMLSTSEKYE